MTSHFFLQPPKTIAFALVFLPSFLSHAQAPPVFAPDAGAMLNLYAPPAKAPELPKSSLSTSKPPPITAEQKSATDTKVFVKRFAIEGASLLPKGVLDALIANDLQKEVSFDRLQTLLSEIDETYRLAGYFLVRSYFPPQDVTNGEIRLVVQEGTYGKIATTGGERLSSEVLETLLQHQGILPEKPVFSPDLERAVILSERFSGAPMDSLLRPGQTLGTADLVLTPSKAPLTEFSLGTDNYGSRYSGSARFLASVSFNSPTRIGDKASLWSSSSEGSRALYAMYQRPIGYHGLTLGGSFSHYEYKLCCEFKPLKMQGSADVGALQIAYPWVLRTDKLLSLGASLEHKKLTDESVFGLLKDKRVALATFSVDGMALLAGGQGRFRTQITHGHLTLKAPEFLKEGDAFTGETEGRYTKLSGALEYARSVFWDSQLSFKFSGQTARQNLDSSEKMSLGGQSGLRAYPEGEASGDKAWLFRADWVFPMPTQNAGIFAFRTFFDTGGLWINANTQTGIGTWATDHNHYRLSGAGFGFSWLHPQGGLSANLNFARRIGENPGANFFGNDSDGRLLKNRVWFGANLLF